ncbi:unnamed protein product [Sphenostylis stenocarpa]|uniref:BZIP domain-containing protein n=1 Tax=Sphenostylis stenocarpa TaxID=92480 RepID=A0AA86SQM2_9FABA|nr:unnamed protein product [Sphenostylis stenocarpa]
MGELKSRGTLIKPIPLRAQAMSSQPWRKPSNPLHKLATIPENDVILTEENSGNGDRNTSNEALANIQEKMENKFKRSRLKKVAYVEELENELRLYERKKEIVNGQIAEQRKKQVLLQIEHHSLRFHVAAREKQRILQEAEIEKNRAEVDRMLEVQRRMINLTSLQLVTNSNLNPSPFAGLNATN